MPGQPGQGAADLPGSQVIRALLKRPHFDRADPGDRVPGRYRDRLVEVRALDYVVTADLLLGLGERSVSDQHLGGAQADRPRLADRLQVSTMHAQAVPDRLFGPGVGGGLHLRRLIGAQFDTLIDAMNQHVAHGSSGPVLDGSGWRSSRTS